MNSFQEAVRKVGRRPNSLEAWRELAVAFAHDQQAVNGVYFREIQNGVVQERQRASHRHAEAVANLVHEAENRGVIAAPVEAPEPPPGSVVFDPFLSRAVNRNQPNRRVDELLRNSGRPEPKKSRHADELRNERTPQRREEPRRERSTSERDLSRLQNELEMIGEIGMAETAVNMARDYEEFRDELQRMSIHMENELRQLKSLEREKKIREKGTQMTPPKSPHQAGVQTNVSPVQINEAAAYAADGEPDVEPEPHGEGVVPLVPHPQGSHPSTAVEEIQEHEHEEEEEADEEDGEEEEEASESPYATMLPTPSVSQPYPHGAEEEEEEEEDAPVLPSNHSSPYATLLPTPSMSQPNPQTPFHTPHISPLQPQPQSSSTFEDIPDVVDALAPNVPVPVEDNRPLEDIFKSYSYNRVDASRFCNQFLYLCASAKTDFSFSEWVALPKEKQRVAELGKYYLENIAKEGFKREVPRSVSEPACQEIKGEVYYTAFDPTDPAETAQCVLSAVVAMQPDNSGLTAMCHSILMLMTLTYCSIRRANAYTFPNGAQFGWFTTTGTAQGDLVLVVKDGAPAPEPPPEGEVAPPVVEQVIRPLFFVFTTSRCESLPVAGRSSIGFPGVFTEAIHKAVASAPGVKNRKEHFTGDDVLNAAGRYREKPLGKFRGLPAGSIVCHTRFMEFSRLARRSATNLRGQFPDEITVGCIGIVPHFLVQFCCHHRGPRKHKAWRKIYIIPGGFSVADAKSDGAAGKAYIGSDPELLCRLARKSEEFRVITYHLALRRSRPRAPRR